MYQDIPCGVQAFVCSFKVLKGWLSVSQLSIREGLTRRLVTLKGTSCIWIWRERCTTKCRYGMSQAKNRKVFPVLWRPLLIHKGSSSKPNWNQFPNGSQTHTEKQKHATNAWSCTFQIEVYCSGKAGVIQIAVSHKCFMLQLYLLTHSRTCVCVCEHVCSTEICAARRRSISLVCSLQQVRIIGTEAQGKTLSIHHRLSRGTEKAERKKKGIQNEEKDGERRR